MYAQRIMKNTKSVRLYKKPLDMYVHGDIMKVSKAYIRRKK